MYAYVVENDNKVTDFVSFYALPSSILRHEKHTQLKAAYSFWNVATTADLNDLMKVFFQITNSIKISKFI